MTVITTIRKSANGFYRLSVRIPGKKQHKASVPTFELIAPTLERLALAQGITDTSFTKAWEGDYETMRWCYDSACSRAQDWENLYRMRTRPRWFDLSNQIAFMLGGATFAIAFLLLELQP